MLFLFFAIVSASSIALLFKFTESKGMNRLNITMINYLSASIISLLFVATGSGFKSIFLNFNLTSFNSISSIFKSESPLEVELIWTYAILIGMIGGIFFLSSFLLYQKTIKESGAALAGTFMKMGIIIPIFFSILFWHEIPSSIQWVGIVLSLISIVLVNYSKKFSLKNLNLFLLLLLISGGFMEFSNKFFQKYGAIETRDFYLFIVFFTAFFLSSILVLIRKNKFNRSEVFLGLLIGIPNLFASYFIILSFKTLKTSTAFAVYGAGSIILITIFAWILFKERLLLKEKIAILISVFSIILMNL